MKQILHIKKKKVKHQSDTNLLVSINETKFKMNQKHAEQVRESKREIFQRDKSPTIEHKQQKDTNWSSKQREIIKSKRSHV